MAFDPAGISSLLNTMYFNSDSSHMRETKTVTARSVNMTRNPEGSNSSRTIDEDESDNLPEKAMMPYFISHSMGTEADRATLAERYSPSNPGNSTVIESAVDLDDLKA
ncbi:MAG: hypothetical protein ACKOYC_03110 [Bacteroidota bacterium]